MIDAIRNLAVVGGTYAATNLAYGPLAVKLDGKATSQLNKDLAWIANSAIPIVAAQGILRLAHGITGSNVFHPLNPTTALVAIYVSMVFSKRNPFQLNSFYFNAGQRAFNLHVDIGPKQTTIPKKA